MALSVAYTNFGGTLVSENRGGTERQYLRDTLGSLVAEISTGQSETYQASYWPYGEVASESGTRQSDWGFVGLLGYMRDLASLLYVRARHYLPAKARWLSSDDMWPEQNAFTYVGEAPVYAIDPTGTAPQSPDVRLTNCSKAWNAYIFNYCNECYKSPSPACKYTCHLLANEYYRRCKGVPGPFKYFSPPPGGGEVAPRPTPQLTILPCDPDAIFNCVMRVGWGQTYEGKPVPGYYENQPPPKYFDKARCKACCYKHLGKYPIELAKCLEACDKPTAGIWIIGGSTIINGFDAEKNRHIPKAHRGNQ